MHEVNVRREAKIKRQLQKPEMRITIDTAQKACGEPSNLIWNVVGSGARKVSAEVEEGGGDWQKYWTSWQGTRASRMLRPLAHNTD